MGRSNRELFFGCIKPGVNVPVFYDPIDKEVNAYNYIQYMLARTQSMFEYDGLPESIPQRSLELFLQANGNVCFYPYNGELYVFTGGIGGVPDAYYRPTEYIIANPGLKLNAIAKIGVDCVVMLNDSMYMGLLPMFSKYALALVENELSLNIATINSRITSLISAPNDNVKESAERYLKQIAEGKLGVIADPTLINEGLKTLPYATAGASDIIMELIEQEQYLKASWYHDLGLNANYNMKREAINSTEAGLNTDALLPLIDDMLKCRQQGLEKVNAMFGTNITVKLNSSWEDVHETVDAAIEALESEGDELSERSENEDTGGEVEKNTQSEEMPEDESE